MVDEAIDERRGDHLIAEDLALITNILLTLYLFPHGPG